MSSKANCRDTRPDMPRRPSRRYDYENHERWLVSYADFITLLFAFFVVMYAISSVNEGKYKTFGASLVSAFSGSSKLENIATNNDQSLLLKALVERRNARTAEERQRKQQEFMQVVAKNLNQVMAPMVKNDQVSVTTTKRGVELEIKASALFKEGEAVLQENAAKILAGVAQVLVLGDQAIEVEGHTDSIPINTPQFPSNWELSSARASSVVRLFIERGVSATRLTAVGSADNLPLAPNDTPEGRTRNRRVTVTILAPGAERLVPQPMQ